MKTLVKKTLDRSDVLVQAYAREGWAGGDWTEYLRTDTYVDGTGKHCFAEIWGCEHDPVDIYDDCDPPEDTYSWSCN